MAISHEMYKAMTDYEKYLHWRNYKPADEYMARIRRMALKQYKETR
jgi:hypothetical protein